MCILVFSTSSKEYPFILISNRDEFFKRKTQKATIHSYQNQRILSPQDLQRNGTWLAINLDRGKIAVLVNFRERTRILSESINNLSRGILPLEVITSQVNSKNEFIEQLYLKYNHELTDNNYQSSDELLGNIGGFSLFYGDLIQKKFDIISNKNNDDFKIIKDYDSIITHGLSNSSFDQPWPKVKSANYLLKELITANESNLYSKDLFVEKLFDILSTSSTLSSESSYPDSYEEIPKNIFVPPLINDENHIPIQGKYYGTRTQTVILVDNLNRLTYVEKTLHSNDLLFEEPSFEKFELDLNIITN
ncbi:hypothetical protein WICMUC_004969 [Wickerhamomyces mucosus]|uniref:Transport and Golgi organization protein 2 n=1 Tax=Wickerhamomyces mucosus TaxID=1378264 RepID=A0A9P8PCW5_9ASCO|nr:hypothetical protein WICMUC_004969 [Wickerhamomyces mucosus]